MKIRRIVLVGVRSAFVLAFLNTRVTTQDIGDGENPLSALGSTRQLTIGSNARIENWIENGMNIDSYARRDSKWKVFNLQPRGELLRTSISI